MAAVLHSRSLTSRAPGPGRVGAIVAVGLHVAVAALLLSYEPARSVLRSVVPIIVELLAPPAPEPRMEQPAKPAIEPPKPTPVAKVVPKPRPTPPQPILTAPATAPSPVAAPPQPPAPVATTASSADGAPAGAPEGAPGGAKAGLSVTEPIFNADYLENPAPAYPALSRRSGEQGKVMLRVLVSPAGRADDVQVRSSSGSPRLDEAARTTVLRWKFVPAKRGNEAVSAWVLIPISFRLEG